MNITTPYDMLINQRSEIVRGDELHGSVGVGFGETIERSWVHSSLNYDKLLRWAMFGPHNFEGAMWKHLDNIRKDYVPSRVDLTKVHHSFVELLNSDELIYEFTKQTQKMMELINLMEYESLEDRNIIFEGAQGLLLDQDYGYFPYVTRSNCGMRNIRTIMDQIEGSHDLTVNYVTRAYTTRHGAGPLDRSDSEIANRHNIVDNTNLKNDWQGELRFAPLNLDTFNSVTNKDFLNYAPRGSKKVTTVTCLDQLDGNSRLIEDGTTHYVSANSARERAHEKFDFGSYGPTRETVVDYSGKL